ncbi:MAG: hypothetical protein BWY79_01073 [Actinobacteria bacterium ADurb.Bin444]|nr:MAG: hypothetical protein BWY79_01073 [Actinobacteria bacterium ADurb.Bin444]
MLPPRNQCGRSQARHQLLRLGRSERAHLPAGVPRLHGEILVGRDGRQGLLEKLPVIRPATAEGKAQRHNQHGQNTDPHAFRPADHGCLRSMRNRFQSSRAPSPRVAARQGSHSRP